jgi:catechol 2,3-dioxygenase
MDSDMTIGVPVLRIKNIDKVIAFYENSLGLQVNKRYTAHDGNGRNSGLIYEIGPKYASSMQSPLLILHHDPKARDISQHSAGLFHFAMVVPDRKSLASTYLSLIRVGVRYDGFADHLVSESLYLRDPENNGIEIYRDRPSKEWPHDKQGHILMDTLPLDLDSLVAEVDNQEQEKRRKGKEEQNRNITEAFSTGVRIGHMHLRVTNLERSIRFYREKLGLDMMIDWRSVGAAFLSAGGYHHHIGINTWRSLDGEKVHSGSDAGLENFTITIPDKSSFKTLKSIFDSDTATSEQQKNKQKSDNNHFSVFDPDGIHIVIKSS